MNQKAEIISKQSSDVNRLKTIDHENLDVNYSKATDFINTLIHEYLLKKSFNNTLDAFQVLLII